MSPEDTPTDALAPADAQVIQTVCQRVPGVIAVYRFGSSVEGPLRADSDLDYAVLARRPLEPMERFDLQEDLALALGRSVDLVDLRRASVVMRMQVIAGARVLASYDPSNRSDSRSPCIRPTLGSTRSAGTSSRRSWRSGPSLVDDVVVNKVAVIERCLARVEAEYGGDERTLRENITRQNSRRRVWLSRVTATLVLATTKPPGSRSRDV